MDVKACQRASMVVKEVNGCPSKSMNLKECPWKNMKVNERPLMSTDVNECKWISNVCNYTDVNGWAWTSMDVKRMNMDFSGCVFAGSSARVEINTTKNSKAC